MSIVNRLRWYKYRLAAMSAAEIMHRIKEGARRRCDRSRAGGFAAIAHDYGELPQIPGLLANIDAWNTPTSLLDQWAEDARRAQCGEHNIFGKQWPTCARADMWHIDPLSGAQWPRDVFCFDIDYRHGAKNGDIKFTWELNRLQYLQSVAALARKHQDGMLARFCLSEIESWIDNNPPFLGVNWNSGIELALRVISILTVTTLVGDYLLEPARGKIWTSLQTHARWIARYPSLYSSSNNHRAAEGLGLFAVGALCPQFTEAEIWKNKGWDILCDQARRLILPDGAGAEQAIAYAASTCEALLTGLKIARARDIAIPDHYLHHLTLGGEYLRWLTDASGNTPHIGDDDDACVFGAHHSGDTYVAGILASIAAMASRVDLMPPRLQPHLRQAVFGAASAMDFAPAGVRCFSYGGMTVGRHQSLTGNILLAFDHGPLGYLSIAAHGHADALALWLHIGGQPVFVDSGTYLYHSQTGERRYFRGAKAHNTLTINDTDSSAQAGAFNWSHKARATLRHFESRGDFWQIEAEHDGYLENFRCLHRRGLHVSPATGAVVEDMIVGPTPQQVEINFLLHPDLAARRDGHDLVVLKGEQLVLRLRHESTLETVIGEGSYSPEFGVKQAAAQISFKGILPPNQKAVTHFFWAV